MKGKARSALKVAKAAEAQAAAHRETPATKQQRVAELEERARLFGDSVKQSAQAKVLERKWLRFLLVHAEEYGFDESTGPTVELVEKFVTYSFCTRDRVSAIAREGLGDSFELQLRYMLAKFVFVSLEYVGWTGLNAYELHKKAEPYKFAVCEHWKRLKRSDPDLLNTLKPFVKAKWDDTAYFQAQVRCSASHRPRGVHCLTHGGALVWQEHNMSLFEAGEMHMVVFVTRMTVMGFVRATCSRGGSVCKDWFDRAGKMVYWLKRNVLSVSDFLWGKEGMELELPDGSTETDPLRGEVKLNRVKHHYHEAGYEYSMSVTADAVQAARRGGWWIFLYQFSRGLFKVQYEGMSMEAIEASLSDRAENGHHGIMPSGACISAVSALRRWLAGERAYLQSLESEPFFVQPKGRNGKGGGQFVFSTKEMSTDWFGAVFREVGDEMGLRPHASGLNSVRRNSMVGVQKGAERAGFDSAMHAKKTSQHRGDGHACREKVYEDSTASTDIGAFLMGRTPQVIESLKSLAMTRVPELALFRKFSDVAVDDEIRVALLDTDQQRLAVKGALEAYEWRRQRQVLRQRRCGARRKPL